MEMTNCMGMMNGGMGGAMMLAMGLQACSS